MTSCHTIRFLVSAIDIDINIDVDIDFDSTGFNSIKSSATFLPDQD